MVYGIKFVVCGEVRIPTYKALPSDSKDWKATCQLVGYSVLKGLRRT